MEDAVAIEPEAELDDAVKTPGKDVEDGPVDSGQGVGPPSEDDVNGVELESLKLQ